MECESLKLGSFWWPPVVGHNRQQQIGLFKLAAQIGGEIGR